MTARPQILITDRRSRDRREYEPTIPPSMYSCESEQWVLGALMIEPSAPIDGIITADDFYSDANRRIFRHIQKLIIAGTHPDPVTLCDSLTRSNEIEQAGGFDYVADLTNIPSAANVVAHARIVRERAMMRELLAYGERVVALAGGSLPVAEALKATQEGWNAVKASYTSQLKSSSSKIVGSN